MRSLIDKERFSELSEDGLESIVEALKHDVMFSQLDG